MDESDGSAIENTASSPEKKKSSSKPTRGTSKRGRGRPKRIQKSASDNEASLNGGQPVACLKHVGKFRYLSNLTQAESAESESSQNETTQQEPLKSTSTRGKRGSGRGRGRGRGAANQTVPKAQSLSEPSSHVSSRGRRIKPNNRWSSDAELNSTKPARGGSRRSTSRGAKRLVEGEVDTVIDALPDKCIISKLHDASNESDAVQEKNSDNHSEEDVKTKANGNIEDTSDDASTETETMQEQKISTVHDLPSIIIGEEVVTEPMCEAIEICPMEESAIVVEVESSNLKAEEVTSSVEEDIIPTEPTSSEESQSAVNEVVMESNDEAMDSPCTEEVILPEVAVSQVDTPAPTVNSEYKIEASSPPDAHEAIRKEYVIDEKESVNSNNEAIELTPDCTTSSASNTPKHEDDLDSQSMLLSPKPVKVKSRWRRTSELEQVICRTKTEPVSNESASITTPEAAAPSPSDGDTKTNEVFNIFSSVDDKILVEERLNSFDIIEENKYLTNRKTSKEVKRMQCDCTLSKEEIAREESGCGEDCINRLLMIECGSRCQLGDRCTNKRFQKRQYAKLEVFNAGKKGVGLRALEDLSPGDFIIEYVGEVIDPREFHKRAKEYSRDKNMHFYFMALKSDAIIDATGQGNISRFINHSCDPNAETQKWTVNGDLRVGFFVRRHVQSGEELTFDYQFQRYGKEAQRCYCESENCRGWIGEEPEKEEKGREKKEKKDKRRKSVLRDEVNTIDLDSEIEKLAASGVKNRAHTLNLSRLMVRAEDLESRKNILTVLRNAEQPCRRLFLDYHGLKLLWGWMVDASSAGNSCESAQFKLDLLSALSSLPVPNKNMLLDSKVLSIVEKWTAATDTVNDVEKTESTENDASVDKPTDLNQQVVSISLQLLESWSSLKEVFRIPKKERIEEMKEHEREADRERIDASESLQDQTPKTSSYDRRPSNYLSSFKDKEKMKRSRESPDRETRKQLRIENDSLTKEERRRLFALKVAQQEEELRARRNQEDVWRRHLEQCLSLTLETAVPPGNFEATPCIAPTSPGIQAGPQVLWDPVMARWQPCPEENGALFISNPALTPLSESSSTALPKIPTEPPLLHLIIPKGYDPTSMGPLLMDFDASEYETTGIPYVPACLVVQQPTEETSEEQKADEGARMEKPANKLPRFWRQAQDDRGRTYYYHVKIRLPQWEPPTPDGHTPDFSSEEEEVEEEQETSQPATVTEPTTVSIPEDTKEVERTNRRNLLCKEKIISPRSDFERSDDAQRYRELKERLLRYKLTRIRERGLWVDETKVEHKSKHKDKDRRRLTEKEKEKLRKRAKEKYKRSMQKAESRKKNKEQQPSEASTSIEPISESTTQVDGNDSISEKDLIDASVDDETLNLGEGEDEAAEQERNRDVSANTVRKIKDAFRMKISADIVNILNPYRRPDCKLGRITCTDDFKHLARKMTHFVLAKELKHCRNIEDLVVNDSVKHKAKDFIKKYMMKFGPAYKRGNDDDA